MRVLNEEDLGEASWQEGQGWRCSPAGPAGCPPSPRRAPLIRSMESVGSMSISISLPVSVLTLMFSPPRSCSFGHEVERRLLLDVVVGERGGRPRAACPRRRVLVGRDPLLVLDLRLHVLDGVRRLHLERHRLAGQRVELQICVSGGGA